MLDSESVDLGKWLAENGVIVSENESWIDYVLDINGNKPFHANEIHCFVKNAYGKPYIPGSSLKGALRTAIFIYMVKNALESDNLIEFQKKFEELEKCKYHGSKAGIKKLGNCDKELVEEMFYQLRINKKIQEML